MNERVPDDLRAGQGLQLGVSVASAARGSVMLFIGEATVFSSECLVLAADDSLRENCEDVRALKLKNPRTSVGAGPSIGLRS